MNSSGVQEKDILDAIENKYYVYMRYENGKKNDRGKGERRIKPVAYGLTKRGYPVVRAFEVSGSTNTIVPHWKYFRVDRIKKWKITASKKTFQAPDRGFNPVGDKTMSVVFKIADFGKKTPSLSTGPKTKEDENQKIPNRDNYGKTSANAETDNNGLDNIKTDTFKTETERGLDKLRKQLENPMTIEDYWNQKRSEQTKTKPEEQKNGGVESNHGGLQSGPKTTSNYTTQNQEKQQQKSSGPKTVEDEKDKPKIEPYRTETEKRMEGLRKQLENPITLSDYWNQKNQNTEKISESVSPKNPKLGIGNDKFESTPTCWFDNTLQGFKEKITLLGLFHS